MKTTGVFTLTETPIPVRGYIRYSAENAFDQPYKEKAKEHLEKVIKQRNEKGRFQDIAFAIGIIWGRNIENQTEPSVDLFGYKIDPRASWQTQNPTVYAWTIHNGVYSPSPEISCEDGLIILGKEAEHRRSTTSLEAYMRELPPFARDLTF